MCEVTVVNILIQPGYRSNITLKKILSGISDSASERTVFFTHEDEIDNDEKTAVVIGVDKEWEKNVCTSLLSKQIHPIIVFPSWDISHLPCSHITTDDFFTFSQLTKMLAPHSTKGIALAGFNPSSSTDIIKLNGYKQGLELCQRDFNPEFVLESNDNIYKYIENAVAKKDEFDTLICVNDITAILACAMLGDIDKYNITGFNGMLCTKYTNPRITTIGVDYYSLGLAVVEAYKSLSRNSFLLKQSFFVKSKLIPGQTTPALTDEDIYTIKYADASNSYKQLRVYDDNVFQELDAVEILLQKSDEIDFKILKMLMTNKKYEEISAELFLSITPLKYRINKMLKFTGFKTKSELVNTLRKYNVFSEKKI